MIFPCHCALTHPPYLIFCDSRVVPARFGAQGPRRASLNWCLTGQATHQPGGRQPRRGGALAGTTHPRLPQGPRTAGRVGQRNSGASSRSGCRRTSASAKQPKWGLHARPQAARALVRSRRTQCKAGAMQPGEAAKRHRPAARVPPSVAEPLDSICPTCESPR